MEELGRTIQALTEIGPELQARLLKTVVVLLVLQLAHRMVDRVVRSRTEDVRLRYRWHKTTSYIAAAIGFLAIGRIWFDWFRSLATFFGLVSAGLAIALRDMIVDLAGWLFIIWRRPFAVGDRVQIGTFAGDVVDQRVFQFTLLEIGNWVDADQSTGRVIHVPNGKIFTEPLANYSQGLDFIWNEIPVLVTFESDWKKAKRILEEIAAKHATVLDAEAEARVLNASRKYMIFYSTLQPRVYTGVRDSGVLLTIRYLCEPRRRRGTAEIIWEKVLDAFAQERDIDFAYPTRRLYDNAVEGKKGARAEPVPHGGLRGSAGDGPYRR